MTRGGAVSAGKMGRGSGDNPVAPEPSLDVSASAPRCVRTWSSLSLLVLPSRRVKLLTRWGAESAPNSSCVRRNPHPARMYCTSFRVLQSSTYLSCSFPAWYG